MVGRPAVSIDVDRLLRSPRRFPLQISVEEDSLILVEARRDDYRRAAYLDVTGFRGDATIWEASLETLAQCSGGSVTDLWPRFLFHTSFCCSTLVSRCIEASPDAFVLREPMVLRALELEWGRTREQNRVGRWNDAVGLVGRLLGRVWSPRQTAVVKTDCIAMLGALRDVRPTSYTVLWSSARDFMSSVLTRGDRRAWALTRLAQLVEASAAAGLRPPLDSPRTPSAAEAAALVWWWQMWLLREAGDRSPTARAWLLSEDQFLDSPIACLQSLFDALQVSADAEHLAPVIGKTLARDAKDPQRPLDGAERRKKLAQAYSEHRDELEAALRTIGARVGGDDPWRDPV